MKKSNLEEHNRFEHYNLKKVFFKRSENSFQIMIQALFGNRVLTYAKEENLDNLILGWFGKKQPEFTNEKIDRSVVKIPGTKNLYLIYNKYKEEEVLEYMKSEEYLERIQGGFGEQKALAYIPGLGIKLYNRCLVCKMDENGHFLDLEEEDFELFLEYLTE
ncbi:hypothetical protein SAMN05216249_10419 [Acetitomaculum ruminis DSM 5522]|uniref:Uncharacterized protein n=1 Tax=Acetitomaculum ruminis DSM 5522 TaxID=1120918 RepID=A0A1I0WDW2_9FIRM|nr:hypothetical protein [Acetitomaculum ruminis]SFA86821.1 hypothetical protein SAMN05216249_10419 [Acetitomaculum ruminis DSM 5522]